jgi:membrane fusion protein (multidrug efflux system)
MTAPRTRFRWRMIALTCAILVAVAAAIYGTVSSAQQGVTAKVEKEATDEAAPIPVELAEISAGSMAAYISATANLVAEDQVTILSEVEGRVAELKVEEGDLVGRGDILAIVSRDEAEIAATKAELRASNAQLAYERARGTLEQGLISREEYDRLEMEHEVARQEVAEAQWNLAKTLIRAPFAGHVTERFITIGQHLRHGDQLFTLADFEPLVARIYLPEKDVLKLEKGRSVRITLAAEESVHFAGRIRQIAPVVDTSTGTVKVTVEALAPPAQVRPGAFVTVDIVRERREQAVMVPKAAVIRELGSAYVFVSDGSLAHRRDVTLGLEEGSFFEALSGVEPGDKVVVAGQGGLKEGAKIKST